MLPGPYCYQALMMYISYQSHPSLDYIPSFSGRRGRGKPTLFLPQSLGVTTEITILKTEVHSLKANLSFPHFPSLFRALPHLGIIPPWQPVTVWGGRQEVLVSILLASRKRANPAQHSPRLAVVNTLHRPHTDVEGEKCATS